MRLLKCILAACLILALLLPILPLSTSAQEGEPPAAAETTTPTDQDGEQPEDSPPPAATAQPFATLPLTDKAQMPTPAQEPSGEVIVIAPEGAGFFELPDHGSAMLEHLEAGAVLQLKLLGQSWSQVTLGEATGYVPTQALSLAFGASQPVLALATAPLGKLTLRAEMSTRSKALATVRPGRAVLMLARGEVFSLVRHEGQEGYLLSAHLVQVPVRDNLGTYTQVVSLVETREANVRLRAEPAKNAAVYTTVPSGQFVVVLDIADGWAQVEYQGYHGYMMADYLKRFD